MATASEQTQTTCSHELGGELGFVRSSPLKKLRGSAMIRFGQGIVSYSDCDDVNVPYSANACLATRLARSSCCSSLRYSGVWMLRATLNRRRDETENSRGTTDRYATVGGGELGASPKLRGSMVTHAAKVVENR
jgi:hypothetical protein